VYDGCKFEREETKKRKTAKKIKINRKEDKERPAPEDVCLFGEVQQEVK
jgi:hypothetical protein